MATSSWRYDHRKITSFFKTDNRKSLFQICPIATHLFASVEKPFEFTIHISHQKFIRRFQGPILTLMFCDRKEYRPTAFHNRIVFTNVNIVTCPQFFRYELIPWLFPNIAQTSATFCCHRFGHQENARVSILSEE